MNIARVEEYMKRQRRKKRARQSNSSTANDSESPPQSTTAVVVATTQQVGTPETQLSAVVNNTATVATAAAASAALGTTADNVDNSNNSNDGNTTDMDVDDEVTAKVTEDAATKLLEVRVTSVEEGLLKLESIIANNDGMQLDSDEEMEEEEEEEEEEEDDDTSKTAVGNGKCWWFYIDCHAVPFDISNLTCIFTQKHKF